jgi:hypothetical protein
MNDKLNREEANLEGDNSFSRKPGLTAAQQIEEFERQALLGKRNWLGDLVGLWPGDETDEEFEQLLKDLD